MKKVVLPISTFAVGFLIAFLVFKLSFTNDLENIVELKATETSAQKENIKPKTKEELIQEYIDNLAPEKKELISNMTPIDHMVWNKLRKEKEADAIMEGDEIWANGFSTQERFDEDIVYTFAGEYQGIYNFKDLTTNKTQMFNIKISFKGTKPSDLNTIGISNKEKENFSTTFSAKDLGLDANNVQLIVTWANPNINPFYYLSHFAFKIPLLQTEQTGKYTLYGLDGEFDWQEIGEIELKRLK